jgi:molybdopterin/thiamine biosynthesis adenylyltransferase
MTITQRIKEVATAGRDAADRPVRTISDGELRGIADESQSTFGAVCLEALRSGVYPVRYLRNRETVSLEEQIRLAGARVGVIGAGGLGGHVIMHLARAGVGFLRVVDYDVFDESNLNRQLLAEQATLGRSKSVVAAERVAGVNPAVTVEAVTRKIESSGAGQVLAGVDVVVDALDNVPDRFILAQAARDLGIPLVHGAIAGLEGRVMTIFPEDAGLEMLYGEAPAAGSDAASPEAVMGTPTFSPAVVATLQAVEVVKIVLNRGHLFRNQMAYIDLAAGRLEIFKF